MASSRDTVLIDIPNFTVSIVSTYSPHACIPTSHPPQACPSSPCPSPWLCHSISSSKTLFFLVHVVNIHVSFGTPTRDLSPGQICLDSPVFLSVHVFSQHFSSLYCSSLVVRGFSLGCTCLERKAVCFFSKPVFKHGPWHILGAAFSRCRLVWVALSALGSTGNVRTRAGSPWEERQWFSVTF